MASKRPKIEDTLELVVYARRCLISFYILCFYRVGTKNIPTKDLNQDLLQEIEQAIIDGSLESLQMEICNAIQDFEISDIPFMIDD
jgi:hypothetical protein